MNIGDRIKQRREELGISAEELADKIGKSRATVYRYENGDIGNMPTTILEPLATALNTTPAYLMGWDKETELNYIEEAVRLEAEACQAETFFGPGVADMLIKYGSMNEIGKKKVRDNIDDLVLIYATRGYPYLAPQAAHEQTDIEASDEMRQHDDDIMNDDSEWE